MRRNYFLVTVLVAVATFATLSAFVHKPYGWHRGWRHERFNDDYHNRDHHRDHHSPTERPPVSDSLTDY